ncbi:MAG: ATP-binding protein [Rhodothermales bacterium]
MVRFRLLLTLACAALLAACTPPLDNPKAYSHLLKEVRPHGQYPVDLTGDGVDELVYIIDYGDAVMGLYLSGDVIDQHNYEGRVLSDLHFPDLDGDGDHDVLVPVERNDSLFISFLDERIQSIGEGLRFVAAKEPRIEPEGEIPWKPRILQAYAEDINKDGHAELITLIGSGRVLQPRGLWIHSLPDGELIDTFRIGSAPFGFGYQNAPDDNYMSDFDGDGWQEIVFVTGSSNNGGSANGIDDVSTYLGIFELGPEVKLWFREMGGLRTGTGVTAGDFDGDGTIKYLVSTSTYTKPSYEPGRLFIFNPATHIFELDNELPEPLVQAVTVNLNQDATDEIIALGESGTLFVYNAQLEFMWQRPLADSELNPFLHTLPDIDGDGVDEIYVRNASRTLFLSPDLRVKAVWPQGVTWKRVHRGGDLQPYLLGLNERRVLFEFVENPLWWLYRYGPPALGIGVALLALGLVISGARLYRRQRSLEATEYLVLDTDERGVLLVGRDGQIERMNPIAKTWLWDNGHPNDRSGDDLRQRLADFFVFLDDLATAPPVRNERTITLGTDEQALHLCAVADPMSPGRSGPAWIVRLNTAPTPLDGAPYRTWGLMAQRVAHDLKTPLTIMLLTLQRMQMEYRKRAPHLAQDLDPFAERIEERIEHLRRMTKNFMKFVDLEEPTLVEADLDGCIPDWVAPIRNDLPPDIQLALKPTDTLPVVCIDVDQMASLLENLVANAIHAMPDGGVITISTHVARDVRFSAELASRTYVVLEVMDTGNGIPPERQKRIFEAGFTTTEHGSGLGLALVKKIVIDHKGHIEVESEPGTGSAFSIYLPVGD